MKRFFRDLSLNISLSGFRSNRAEFYEEIAQALQIREHIRDFIRAELAIATTPATRNTSRAFALRLLASRLGSDESRLSRILGGVMPKQDALLLSAVDDASNKPEVLRYIATAIRQQSAMKKLVIKKMVPPLLLMPGIGAMAYVTAAKSIPVISRIAPPEMWVGGSAFVRGFAEFLTAFGGPILLAILGIAVALAVALPRWTGVWRSKLEAVKPSTGTALFLVCPILVPMSIYRDLQAGMVFSALSVLLQSGAKLKDALITLAKNGSPYLRWHLMAIVSHLEVDPHAYQKAFAKGFVSPTMLARLSSQMRTNPRFDQVLIGIGREGMGQVQEQVDKQTSVINFYFLSIAALIMVILMVGMPMISSDLQDQFTPAKMAQRRLKQQKAAAAAAQSQVITVPGTGAGASP